MARTPSRARPPTGDAPRLHLVPPPERPEQPPPSGAPGRPRVVIEQPADASEGARRVAEKVQRGLDEASEARRLAAVAKTLATRTDGDLCDALVEIVAKGAMKQLQACLDRGHTALWLVDGASGQELVSGREWDAPGPYWPILADENTANQAALDAARLYPWALPASLKRAA